MQLSWQVQIYEQKILVDSYRVDNYKIMGANHSQMPSNESMDYEDESYFFDEIPYSVDQQSKDLPQYRSIGAIISTDKGIHSKGTACLIAPNVIVTVAHNVYSQGSKNGEEKKKIRFYPQAFGKLGQGIKVIKIQIPHQYLEGNKAIAYDFVFCRLETDVPQPFCIDIGYNFEYDKIIHNNADKIGIFGYPGSKWKKTDPNAESYHYSVQLMGLNISNQSFQTRIVSTNLQFGEIKHKISTQAGHSGAPIVAKIDGRFIVIGLHKGSMKQKLYNGGVLFNLQFIEHLKKYLHKQKIQNVRIINVSNFSWEQKMIENPPFLIENTKIIRINSSGQEKKRIRSIKLDKLFSADKVMKLRFKNFRYMQNTSSMAFGVIIQVKGLEIEIAYLTARNTNRNEGTIRVKNTIQYPKYPKEMFASEDESVDMTVDNNKLKILFSKGNQIYPIPLDKEFLQASSIVAFAEMRCNGDSLQVSKMIEQF